mmetsp:Transcript_964/g.956  ORF Transcript_964/g.956 Transcript_964/m.956 type:complete len:135 (+) Transcript_964:38-442(+)
MVHSRFVEIGRVAYVNFGPEKDKLCVIVDVIDGKRALVDGAATGVLRQQMPFARLSLTEFVLPVKRNQTSANVAKIFNDSNILSKWQESTHGKQIASRLRRAELTDFDRFKLMVNQKKKSALVRKELKTLKAKH